VPCRGGKARAQSSATLEFPSGSILEPPGS
jgi:hypothetical protein